MMDDCSTSCAFAIYLLFIFSQIAWFHAQVDTTHLIDLDYLYSNFIADVDNILYLRYALVPAYPERLPLLPTHPDFHC